MNWAIMRFFKNLQRKYTKVDTFISVKFTCRSCSKTFLANLPLKRAKNVSDISCICDECLQQRKSISCIDVTFEVLEEKLA